MNAWLFQGNPDQFNIDEYLRASENIYWSVSVKKYQKEIALGDVVFVELPEVGTQLAKDDTFGVVESIKSVSDLYAPATGEVIERNESLESSPELLNKNPYDAWMLKIKVANATDFNGLLSASDYQEFCKDS